MKDEDRLGLPALVRRGEIRQDEAGRLSLKADA